MKLNQVIAVVCTLSMVEAPAHAVSQSDFDQAVAQVQTDSALLGRWLADQFKYIIPFNSTSGAVVPKQLKLLGFEVGVEGTVSGTKVDVDGLRALPTTILDSDTIAVRDRFPMPAVIAHGKIGLPFGMDGGIRLGGIPKKTVTEGDSRIEVKNKIIGIDLRKALIEEGMAKPFGLTVGLSFTHASGDVTATEPYSSNLGTTVQGSSSFSSRLSATGTNRMEWDTNSFGLQAIVNKQIAFFNPYIGASVNRNTGDVTNILTTAGTITLTDVSNSANTASQAVSTSATSKADANKWDVRALLGAEFSILPLLKLGLYGEYAGEKNVAGSFGLRFQFR